MATRVDVRRDVRELTPDIVALRRELHRYPELAFEEVWTAATLARRMRALGLDVHDGLGGTGVLAVLEGARPGRTLLVRADIDALPMEDGTGREYASARPGLAHACGHDVHAAVVAGSPRCSHATGSASAGEWRSSSSRRTSRCAARGG